MSAADLLHLSSRSLPLSLLVSSTLEQEFVPADMSKTLEDNGITDDDEALDKLDMDNDGYIPVIHIYYNDDLTIA